MNKGDDIYRISELSIVKDRAGELPWTASFVLSKQSEIRQGLGRCISRDSNQPYATLTRPGREKLPASFPIRKLARSARKNVGLARRHRVRNC